MLVKEYITIIFMRDSGESKRYRVLRSRYRMLITIFILSPIVAILTSIASYLCFTAYNDILQTNAILEKENKDLQIIVKRLTSLETLLHKQRDVEAEIINAISKETVSDNTNHTAKENKDENSTQKTIDDHKENIEAKPEQDKESIQDKLNAKNVSEAVPIDEDNKSLQATEEKAVQVSLQENIQESKQEEKTIKENKAKEDEELVLIPTSKKVVDDPGHEYFPMVESKDIELQNVSCRKLSSTNLRISFRLRNKSDSLLEGEYFCFLILANGKMIALNLGTPVTGKYAIKSFKSPVLMIDLEKEYDLEDAQVAIEVKDKEGKILCKNSYALIQD